MQLQGTGPWHTNQLCASPLAHVPLGTKGLMPALCPALVLQNTVAKYSAQFRGNSQHDALEFLLWLLDRMHEDLGCSSPFQKARTAGKVSVLFLPPPLHRQLCTLTPGHCSWKELAGVDVLPLPSSGWDWNCSAVCPWPCTAKS